MRVVFAKAKMYNVIYLFFLKGYLLHMSLHYKLVPVQNQEYENGLLIWKVSPKYAIGPAQNNL